MSLFFKMKNHGSLFTILNWVELSVPSQMPICNI